MTPIKGGRARHVFVRIGEYPTSAYTISSLAREKDMKAIQLKFK